MPIMVARRRISAMSEGSQKPGMMLILPLGVPVFLTKPLRMPLTMLA